jgi:predicted nucleic acid-binding protein
MSESSETVSSSIVLDASASVDLTLQGNERGRWVADRLRAVNALHAPHHLDVEVLSTLRRLAHLGVVRAEAARSALLHFEELPIDRYPAGPFVERIWELRDSLTPYDAAYVALAEALDVPLVTTAEVVAYGA